jgi:hypothetical protein
VKLIDRYKLIRERLITYQELSRKTMMTRHPEKRASERWKSLKEGRKLRERTGTIYCRS